ncbi:hypothetical protein U2F10_23860 [Leptothoe sp. EHU-05/26/07-4]
MMSAFSWELGLAELIGMLMLGGASGLGFTGVAGVMMGVRDRQ